MIEGYSNDDLVGEFILNMIVHITMCEAPSNDSFVYRFLVSEMVCIELWTQ